MKKTKKKAQSLGLGRPRYHRPLEEKLKYPWALFFFQKKATCRLPHKDNQRVAFTAHILLETNFIFEFRFRTSSKFKGKNIIYKLYASKGIH